MPTVTGIEKLYWAKLLADSLSAINYQTPLYLPGIKEFDMKPKTNTEKQYAENKLWDQASALDSVDVDITLASVENSMRALMLGQSVAAEGGVYAAQEDEAPYGALLYKATLRNGGYRYGVLYKGAFTLPDDSIKGQEGKPQFIEPKMSATFQPTVYQITGSDGKKKSLWEWHVDTTDPNCPEGIADTWFTAVRFPTVDSTAPTVTVTPADEAASVAASSNIVWTFDKAIDTSTVTKDNFMLLSGGTAIGGTLNVDATGKIVTLDPTDNLETGAYVAVCTANVKSATGIPLANSSISNFTV